MKENDWINHGNQVKKHKKVHLSGYPNYFFEKTSFVLGTLSAIFTQPKFEGYEL